MLDLPSSTNLMLTFALVLAAGWWIISWLTRPVLKVDITAYDQLTEVNGQHVVNRVSVKQPSGPIPLHAGRNDFYLVVKKGELLNYPSSCSHLISPILRDSEDMLFFQVHANVVGNRLRHFNITNLSKSNVRLVWSKVQ